MPAAKMIRFQGKLDGFGPQGLIMDAEGNLYGTTGYGGKDNWGTVFKFVP
jgi:uncharacterized repeat protein (TIGR03803 family)